MRLTLLSLIALGVAISGYLLYRHLVVADPVALAAFDVCSVVLGGGCDDALASPWATQLGLPLAGWGIVYYGALTTLLLLGFSLGDGFAFEAGVGAVLMSLLAAVASLGLLLVMATGRAPFCRFCAVLHVLNVVLAVLVYRSSGATLRRLARSLAAAARYLLGGTVADPGAARGKVVAFLAVGLVAVVLYQWVYLEAALARARRERAPSPVELLAAWDASPVLEIPLDGEDATLGRDDAPATLVVFGDFQCVACRRFARDLPLLFRRFPQRLRVVYKHFPLDAACNPAVRRTRHPLACDAAAAAAAARRQGKFWAFSQALFTAEAPLDGDALARAADRAQLDAARFARDRSAADALAAVERDVALAQRLGVDGTPAVFLNGRRIRDIRASALAIVIEHVLAHSAIGKQSWTQPRSPKGRASPSV